MKRYLFILFLLLASMSLMAKSKHIKVFVHQLQDPGQFSWILSLKVEVENNLDAEVVGKIEFTQREYRGSHKTLQSFQLGAKERIEIPISFLMTDGSNGGNLSIEVEGENYFNEYIYSNSYSSRNENGILVVANSNSLLKNVVVENGHSSYRSGDGITRRSYKEISGFPVSSLLGLQLIVLDYEEFQREHSSIKRLIKEYAGAGGNILFTSVNNIQDLAWSKNVIGKVVGWPNKGSSELNVYKYLEFQNNEEMLGYRYLKNELYPVVFFSKTYDVYLIALVLFALIAGMANYYVLFKYKKRYLMYITFPIFSILFCGFVFLTFVFQEGNRRVYRGESITYLDPVNSKATTIAKTELYQSYVLGRGLSLPNSALVAPIGNRDGSFLIEKMDRQYLLGDFVMPRIQSELGTITHEDNSLVPEVLQKGQDYYVKNKLPQMTQFILVDKDGKNVYVSEKSIEPGQEIKLNKLAAYDGVYDLLEEYPLHINRLLKKKGDGVYLIGLCEESVFAPYCKDESYEHRKSFVSIESRYKLNIEEVENKHFVVLRVN